MISVKGVQALETATRRSRSNNWEEFQVIGNFDPIPAQTTPRY